MASAMKKVFGAPGAAQYFYEEQLHRMECLSQEPVLFEDVLCQMHDMVQPAAEGVFTLQDLKRHKSLAGILFNILFNLNKFIAFETRDPFVVRQVSARASSGPACASRSDLFPARPFRHAIPSSCARSARAPLLALHALQKEGSLRLDGYDRFRLCHG
jgi:hypothetical protein